MGARGSTAMASLMIALGSLRRLVMRLAECSIRALLSPSTGFEFAELDFAIAVSGDEARRTVPREKRESSSADWIVPTA